jgi:hypothetical protein
MMASGGREMVRTTLFSRGLNTPSQPVGELPFGQFACREREHSDHGIGFLKGDLDSIFGEE